MPARNRLIAVGVAAVALLAWWVYPTAARDTDRHDVLIAGDGQVAEASEPLQRRVRELGMSVELQVTDPCPVVDAGSASIVVLSTADPGACGTEYWSAAREAVGSARLIALVQPGHNDPGTAAALSALGVEVVDATRLLGPATADEAPPTRIGCVWWDDCEPDGQVAIRDDAGALTPAGGERLARTLAGALP